ncbi:hypothetical protein BJG92_03374 [Arthrobacter sp. SO5]|nr:hypothetical protein [Arthrobacter sp. SO5]
MGGAFLGGAPVAVSAGAVWLYLTSICGWRSGILK